MITHSARGAGFDEATQKAAEVQVSVSLRDQLLKAGLVSQAQAQATSEPKGRGRGQRGGGGSGGGGDSAASEPAPQPVLERTPENEATIQSEVAGLISQHRIKGRHGGERRWYYATADGRLPFVEMSDEMAGQVEAGNVGLVETAAGTVAYVDAAAMGRIGQLTPERVLHFRRRGGGGGGGRRQGS